MSNKDLFKEAIADAKAVREAALANAKVALEEALAPQLQTMLSAKLQEMELDEANKDDQMEEGFYPDETSDKIQDAYRKNRAALEEDENLEEDFDLSEILAELSEEEINEAKEEGEEEEGDEEESEDETADTEEPEIEDEPAEDSNEKMTDLTVDELKDIIKDIISAEIGSGKMAADMGDEAEEMAIDFSDETGGENLRQNADDAIAHSEEEEIDEIDLEELLAELDSLGDAEADVDDAEADIEGMYEAKKKKEEEKKKDDEKEIKEAIATINTLRSELNEVNLLNAKLLYVNKIFKARNLNESQKLKVIAQFDKATTAKEAKTIYESMSTAIAATSSKKSALKESLGFASKAAGVAPKKNIVEVDETMSRWQMLAGIKKF
jgi:hypothetical protein